MKRTDFWIKFMEFHGWRTYISRGLRSTVFGALIGSVLMNSNAMANNTFGQSSDALNVGAGARSMALGGAFTALADDASAPYYNPAGLAMLDEHQLMLMYAPMYLNTSYNYLSSAHPLGDELGAVAFSDSLLLSSGFDLRDNFNNLTGSGSLSENALFGSYAHKVTQELAVGVNGKLLQQKIAGFSGNTSTFDFGALYRPNTYLSFGTAFANITSPSITLQSAPDVYRPISRFGVAAQAFDQKVKLDLDLTKVSKEKSLYAAGIELMPQKNLSFRGGINVNREFTFGLGVNLKAFHIDYAFSNTDLGAFNKVSITWAWHNIYKTEITPPITDGKMLYPLTGFENQVVFKTDVPSRVVADWTLVISDKDGQEVRRLHGDLRPPEQIIWDAKNYLGEPVVDGAYFYRFQVDYKNGHSWTVGGKLELTLPHRQAEENNNMILQLNGGKSTDVDQESDDSDDDSVAPAEPAAPTAPENKKP